MEIDTSRCKRVTVLKIDGIYSSIHDEAYVPVRDLDQLNKFLHKYSNKNKYRIFDTTVL